MPEVADSCEYHGQTGVIRGFYDLVVANGAARLYHRGCTRFGHRH
jgi:hypothetical protein